LLAPPIQAGQDLNTDPKRKVELARASITTAVRGSGALYPKAASRRIADIRIEPECPGMHHLLIPPVEKID
jgi:hypothetical protein